MKSKLLNQLVIMSRYLIFGLFLQSVLSCMLIADDLHAQLDKKSIEDIYVSINVDNTRLGDVLSQLSKETGFSFAFNEKLVNLKQRVSLHISRASLADILREISRESDLKFKRVNDYIHVGKRLAIEAIEVVEVKQVITITGKVTTSEDNSGLPGVNVIIKDTSQGTVTDVNGNYKIEIPSAESVLVFSSVGYVSEEVMVGNRSVIDIALSPDIQKLGEIVVIGYGSTSKTKLVSSVSTINETKELSKVPITNITESLAGRTPGLFVQNNPDGSPQDGELPRISIRGGGEPLYIVDGIKQTKQYFANIQPEDIESISFLKDASASAVYGAEAADGIVLVTTKRGGAGQEKLSVEYGSNISVQTRLIKPNFLDLYEQALLQNEAAFRDGTALPVSEELLQKYKTGSDPQYRSTDWYDAVLRKFAPLTKHYLSLSGTSNNTTIYLSGNYQTQESPFNDAGEQGTNRYSFRSSVSQKIENIGLTVTGQMDWMRFDARYPAGGSGTVWGWLRQGISVPLLNPDGNYYQYGNPLSAASDKGGYLKNQETWMNNRLILNWEVPWVEGLTINTFMNYLNDANINKNWKVNDLGIAPFYNWDNTLGVGQGSPNLSEMTTNRNKLDLQTQVDYKKTISEDHNISLTAVYTQYKQTGNFLSAYRRDFVSGAVDQMFAGSTTGLQNDGSGDEKAERGWVGRVKYDYKSKYILEFTGRYDGSDNFPEDKRWGFFPAVAAGWNLAMEPFMQNVNEKIKLSSFKLRASWGKTGLSSGASRFGYIPTYNYVNDNYYAGGSWNPGFTEGNLVSSDFTWYERKSTNIGADFSFFDNRLTGSVDWFYYRTTNFLASPSGIYSTPLGKSLPEVLTNSAHRRGGGEFTLGYTTNLKGLNINIAGNLAYYDQLWESKYDEPEATLKNPNTRLTHATDYYTVGYYDLGYYQTMEDFYNNPRQLGKLKYIPGMTMYRDENGDGKIDQRDLKKIGKSNFPHLVYGININMDYKGFSLNALFQAASHRQLYLGYVWYASVSGQRVYDLQKDNWTETNRNAQFPVMSNAVNDYQTTSTKYLVDASYLRLKELSISYDLRHSLLKNVNQIGGLSVFISGTNVFTLSPLKKYYIDPETPDIYNDFGWPVNRAFSVGLRLSL